MHMSKYPSRSTGLISCLVNVKENPANIYLFIENNRNNMFKVSNKNTKLTINKVKKKTKLTIKSCEIYSKLAKAYFTPFSIVDFEKGNVSWGGGKLTAA